ncbi:MAG: FAD-dependent oxidoreductase [Microbacteriaceae bacterium]
MTDQTYDADLLVIGAGMAGLSAGAFAASRGCRVVVVEKADEIGGSAALTGGGLLRPASAEALIAVNPSGDPLFAHALAKDYDAAVEWIGSLGVTLTEPDPTISATMGYPTVLRGHDVLTYLARCKAAVLDNDGLIVTGCAVERLVIDDGRVRGAVVVDRDGPTVVRAAWTLLATGGFQNDAELRSRHLGPNARDMLVRSNRVSDGAGLRLGSSAGGATSARMDRFYGHTVPWPLDHEFTPADYVRLTQHFLSTHCILLDHDGRRFVDESLGYYRNSQMVLARPRGRAVLVGDQRVRALDASGGAAEATLGYERVDRPSEARRSGAHVAEAESLDELERLVAPWGYANVAAAVQAYNDGLAPGGVLDPPRERNRDPIVTAPYFAIEIQSAITNTWGGLRVDDRARVLDRSGEPIGGLLAAGADVGGMYHEAYCGGLGMACVLGLRAARLVVGSLPAAADPETFRE